jgi:pimeloyl-ACP methyl ester carboxylesterase
VFQPGQFDGITAPTLMLAGSESVPVVAEATTLAAAAIHNVQILVLEGHGHFAHRTDPAIVTNTVVEFAEKTTRRS